MSKPIFNKKTVEFFVEMEKEFRLLSGDMLDQSALFAIQDKICEHICNTSNDDRTGYIPGILDKEVPYLFSSTIVEVKK